MSRLRLRLVLGLSLALTFVLAQESTGTDAVPTPPPGDSQEATPDSAPAGDDQDTQPQDTQPQDTQPQDTQPQDAQPQETETRDTQAQDTGGASPAAVQRTVPTDAKPLSNLTLRRDDRVILVNQYAPGAEGGQFVLRAPECGEEAAKNQVRTSTVYGGDAYLVETRINETRITSPIVIQKSPPKEEGGNDKAKLEMLGGSLNVNDKECPENLEPGGQQEVKLEQGRTTVDGFQGLYDNATGIFEMGGGLVNLNRVAEGESPALSADAGNLRYDEATDQILLTENVSIESDGRVSEADSVEFDDANSIAVLTGDPATSRKGDEFFQGSVITYYLDSNDVKVTGNIQGELTLDLGTETPNTTAGEGTDNSEAPTEDAPPQAPDLNPPQ